MNMQSGDVLLARNLFLKKANDGSRPCVCSTSSVVQCTKYTVCTTHTESVRKSYNIVRDF